MSGKPPEDITRQFAADTLTVSTFELSQKYGIAEMNKPGERER